MKTQITNRQKIKYRIRKTINGTAQRPRLSVFRSNSDIYCQLIDDSIGTTLCAASSRDSKSLTGSKIEKAKAVGQMIANKAEKINIKNIVFDRNGFLYHGRVKALADAARENGLNF